MVSLTMFVWWNNEFRPYNISADMHYNIRGMVIWVLI